MRALSLWERLNYLRPGFSSKINYLRPGFFVPDSSHFIMGTMKAHPQTFIIIGILRTGIAPSDLERQGGLFG